MLTLTNIFRRKLRAFLTISGITIGVFALVVMGSMAEKINLLVDGGVRYYSDKVVVTDASTAMMGASAPIPTTKASEIERVPGVAAASAELGMLLDKEGSGMSFGTPEYIYTADPKTEKYESFKISYAKGRGLGAGETGVAVVGSDLAEKLGAKVGKTITVRGEPFTVIGVMEKTLTAPDKSVVISLPDAQRLFVQDLPAMVRSQVDQNTLATTITVYPEPGYDPEQLARDIQNQVPGVKASGPKAFQDQVGNASKIFNAIIFGVALISLLVGGLSVVNTMTMSVYERTREIGIRKAIGASHSQIVRQFLTESAVIGMIGGASGLLFGWIFTIAANAAGNGSGTELFLLTARLAIGSVLFALFLGLLSGLYPSLHAARLRPVAALRYE